MSSLASLVLVSASSISVDLYKGYLHRDISEKNSVILMRVFSVIFIIATYLISKLQIGFIVTLQSLSWGVLSGAFLAPYMLGIYSKKVTKAGAYAGVYAGAGSGIILTMALGSANSALAASIAIIMPLVNAMLFRVLLTCVIELFALTLSLFLGMNKSERMACKKLILKK